MKKLWITWLLAGLFSATALAQITPVPVSVTRTEGEANTWHELSCDIGKHAFARKTASLPQAYREEAYLLTVTPKGYRIQANTETGRFRALQTLRQMHFCGQVYDYPRFPYRGVMLDISRHFLDKDFIIKQMEAMATVKLNVLHLHLTDDAGWRIQIDSYPRLTREAAWRKGAQWKDWVAGGRQYAHMGDPDASGGFLSKEDVKEIVAAAERLHITVIPEIEMPGHSRELVTAYPELGCRKGSEELCPGKETTYDFLIQVLDEVMDMFPSRYIHIGGDETAMTDWEQCPHCRERMRKEGFARVKQLQGYMIRRIEEHLNQRGRRLIGWDDILSGGLSPDATVMSWQGIEGGVRAMKEGHDAIMTPAKWCYINNAQDNPLREPKSEGGYLPLEAIYKYEPFDDVPPELLRHLLGVQACLWQEHIPTPEHTEYMLYPRIAAMAEIGWTRPEIKDYKDFRERMVQWAGALEDGSLNGRRYHPFPIQKEYGERPERLAELNHLAKGCPVTYNGLSWSPIYPAYGKTSLTDGRRGGWAYGDGRWQGFLSDIDVTIDLGRVQPIHYVGASFLCQPGPYIFLPSEITILVSDDNQAFTEAACVTNETKEPVQSYLLLGAPVNAQARYVRFQATRSIQQWLFVDEIVVN